MCYGYKKPKGITKMEQSQKEKELTTFIESLNLTEEQEDKIILMLRALIKKQT